MRCYLRFTDEYEPHRSIGGAKEAFLKVARELYNYGQACEASLHIAPWSEAINEYPDYVLSLNEKGNLKCDKA